MEYDRFIRPKKKYFVSGNMVKKIGSVGRLFFFFLIQTYINSDRVTASRGYGQRARFLRGIIQWKSKNKMADGQIRADRHRDEKALTV